MIAEGIQRLRRNGVDGGRPDEAIHIKRIEVSRVFGAGGGPQRALEAASGGLVAGEALAAEYFAELFVSQFGISDGGLAAQRRPFGQEAIHLRVHAGDEEGRHRGDMVNRQPGCETGVQAGQIGVHDEAVALDGEDQRHVDVDAGCNGIPDGRQSL